MGRNAILIWTGTLSVIIFIATSIVVLPNKYTHSSKPTGIVAAVDAINNPESNQKITVYVDYNDDKYLSYLDSKVEAFLEIKKQYALHVHFLFHKKYATINLW